MAVREQEIRREGVAEKFAQTGIRARRGAAVVARRLHAAKAGKSGWRKIQRRLDRIGTVNLLAIEEFEEQSERAKYLEEQHGDLSALHWRRSRRPSARSTRKHASASRKCLRQRQQPASRSCSRGLFGGGHAYMSLEGDDLLNAGVTVMAQPPGKRNSSIHLLSGGEKALTAVALVFSIFELNPAPFCLLDEVDAPLDDANVGRFCDIVREMSANVQFLFITHNKVTMELASQLMGVTMGEPGVSRLVSVDIDEAVKLAG